MTPQPSDWRNLAEQVSKEMDPTKLTELANQLNQALEREESRRNRRYREVA
jgi:trehalose-6-phosphate synthase